MKLPCDICMWGIIPMIKRELALRLVKEHDTKQTEVSVKLGITKGSVSQYLQGKRASDSGKLNKVSEIKSKLNNLANCINKGMSEKEILRRFCLICKVAQKKIKT